MKICIYWLHQNKLNVRLFNRYEQYAKKCKFEYFTHFFTEHAYLNQFINLSRKGHIGS